MVFVVSAKVVRKIKMARESIVARREFGRERKQLVACRSHTQWCS